MKSLILRSALLALGVAGCNAILDNNRGQLDTSQTPTTVEPNEPTPTEDAGPRATSEGCAANQKMCDGVCVSMSDPAYGCSAASCSPCNATNATATCSANGACAVKVCDPGFDDCNGKASDGCETDLSLATSCGKCGAACPTATPTCAPSNKTFACSTGCTPEAPLLCGTECVSPLSSANHCGGCDTKCPTVAGGTEACTNGACTLTCKAGYHACGADKCALDADATACGPTCTVCPVPANGAATCTANACGIACAAGFGNCNALPADGCETVFATDPLNCGACGVSCNGGKCVNGLCQAPPPPPPAGP